jgi:hypothetical protein
MRVWLEKRRSGAEALLVIGVSQGPEGPCSLPSRASTPASKLAGDAAFARPERPRGGEGLLPTVVGGTNTEILRSAQDDTSNQDDTSKLVAAKGGLLPIVRFPPQRALFGVVAGLSEVHCTV